MSQYYELSPNLSYTNNDEYSNMYCETSRLNSNSNPKNKIVTIQEHLVNLLKEPFEFEFEELPEYDMVQKIIHDFQTINETYSRLHYRLQESIDTTEKEIELMNSHLRYIYSLQKKYENTSNDKFNNMKRDIEELSEKMKHNNELEQIRKEYQETRKTMLRYLSFIKLVNNFNVGSTCSLCLSNNVNMFFDPCGHTSCEECMEKLQMKHGGKPCPFCKKKVIMPKPLYFI
tara:strand:+ start:361 stop:1050 length:690 start_codon:yes stop_codon:yes gene_type:complete